MSGDEYMALLQQRAGDYSANHPNKPGPPLTRVQEWVKPLLEWFVQPRRRGPGGHGKAGPNGFRESRHCFW